MQDDEDRPPPQELLDQMAFEEKFRALPAYGELDALLGRIHNDTRKPVSQAVSLQPGFLDLLAFIEAKNALHANRPPRKTEDVLNAFLDASLHDAMHTLSEAPMRAHPYFAALWDALCDQEGKPDWKVNQTRA